MMSLARKVTVASAVLGLLLVAPAAEGKPTSPKLSFFKGGGATIGWSTAGGSSPSDTYDATRSIHIVNPAGGDAGAFTFGASEALVDIRGETLTGIDRLGFDSKGYLGNGAPRISLGTVTLGDDGLGHLDGQQHTFFLAAFFCNTAIGTSGWRTSDFADTSASPGVSGGSAGCYIYDQNGVAYGPDGLNSVAAAYPNDVVVSASNDWFLIQDEPTVEQGGSATVDVDRLTVENWMWVKGGASGRINCSNPGCI
jgi:hypothetical protein